MVDLDYWNWRVQRAYKSFKQKVSEFPLIAMMKEGLQAIGGYMPRGEDSARQWFQNIDSTTRMVGGDGPSKNISTLDVLSELFGSVTTSLPSGYEADRGWPQNARKRFVNGDLPSRKTSIDDKVE